MSSVQITLQFTEQGWEVVKDATNNLSELNQTAKKTSDEGFGSLISGGANFYGMMMSTVSVLQGGGGLIQSVNDLGTAAIRTDMGFSTLTNGKMSQWLDGMNTATGNLIDNMTLEHDAMMALSTGIVKTSDDMDHLAHTGAVLGTVFMGDAQSGIQAFQNALEHVGQTRPLAALGLDIQAVKAEYNALVKDGIDKSTAWQQALYDDADPLVNKLSPALDTAGSAAERLNKQIKDITDRAGENVAIGVEATLNLVGAGWDFILNHDASGHDLTTNDSSQSGASNFQWIIDSLMGNSDAHNPYVPLMSQGQYNPTFGYNMPVGMDQSWNAPQAGSQPSNAFMKALYGGNGSAFYNSNGYRVAGGYDSSSYYNDPNMNEPSDKPYTSYSGARDTSGVDNLNSAANNAANGVNNLTTASNTASNNLATHFTKFSEAFGTGGNQITQTYGTDMDKAIAAERANIAAEDKKKGMSKAQIDKDLAAYDQSAQQQIDQYNLATGQATAKSLAFRDTQTQLTQAFESGKLSLSEYTKGMLALANAAQDANTSAGSLNWLKAEGLSKTTGVAISGADAEAIAEHSAGVAQVGTGKADPFATTIASANKLAQQAHVAGDSVHNAVNVINTSHAQSPMDSVVKGFQEATNSARNYQNVLTALPQVISADVSIHITGTVSGGGSGTGAKQPTKGHAF